MKIYQEAVVDGLFTVPDLKLDWGSLLSDEYNLWAKYKYALLKFYYSPNHEGSCSDVAQEFNDKVSSLNALIMNFGRTVQKTVGDFAVMRNNKMQYWIISMNGYNDDKNHFVWRLRPDLTEAIKKQLEKEAKLKELFLERFPVESLRTMPIEKYTNLNRKDSFCYWLESETYRLGSIWGGSSLKFGIYQFDKVPKENMPATHDDKYCWLSKYDCETRDEAYEIVKDKIATIAEKAAAGDLQRVDEVDFGDVVKWKIACLYSDNKVFNMYTKELLQAVAKGFGYTGDLNSRPAMNEFITTQYDETRESFYDFYMRVGIHYFGSRHGFIHPENKLHKGGIYLFDGHSGIRYPDFYKEDIVLDAKYKKLGGYSKVSMVDHDDVHQVMAYMTALHVSKGGFVAPLEKKQDKVPTSRISGTTSNLYIFGIEISRVSSFYKDFCEQMKEREKVFVQSINV